MLRRFSCPGSFIPGSVGLNEHLGIHYICIFCFVIFMHLLSCLLTNFGDFLDVKHLYFPMKAALTLTVGQDARLMVVICQCNGQGEE